MSAMIDSLHKAGIKTVINSLDADAVIIWSVLWAGRMEENREVYHHFRTMDRPVIIVDIGALRRGITWKVAINNITADGYYGHHRDLDWGRPRQLGIDLGRPTVKKSHILVAAQHRLSLQTAAVSCVEQWVIDQIHLLQQYTDRPITIRPHPRCRLALSSLPKNSTLEQPRAIADTYDSFDLRFDCHAIINHNSGPGIQAAVQGIRPVVHNSSLAHPVGVNIADIE